MGGVREDVSAPGDGGESGDIRGRDRGRDDGFRAIHCFNFGWFGCMVLKESLWLRISGRWNWGDRYRYFRYHVE